MEFLRRDLSQLSLIRTIKTVFLLKEHFIRRPILSTSIPICKQRTKFDLTHNSKHSYHFNLYRNLGNTLLGVFDGHGKNGANVSKYVQGILQTSFLSGDSFDKASMYEIFSNLSMSLSTSGIKCSTSGTTAWIVVISESRLLWANLGDSRAVLFSQNQNKWDATQLSTDHKVDLPLEKSRIEASGGQVRQFLNSEGIPFGPHRAWKTGENTPGLAMSRSLGDRVAHTIGVISEPGKDFFI